MRIPEKTEKILEILEDAGYEAYVVGGCVRDRLLGRDPHDWDITTSATPSQVKALFPKTVDTGIRHGTVTVMIGQEGFEVTTYRIDGEYEDGRHPKNVTFTGNLENDLERRDFTINAMAYSPRRGLVDLFDGQGDLQRGVVRCVGDPRERFGEDALRMLRAVRFAAQLGFSIDPETADAVRLMAGNLEKVSAERIQAELVKLLLSDHPDDLREAYRLGLTAVFLPEFDRCMQCPQNNPHHQYTVGEHILHSLLHVRPDRILRLTMLLHDIGKPEKKETDAKGIDHFRLHAVAGEERSAQILRRLKFDTQTIRTVSWLILWHDFRPEPTPRAVRRSISRIGKEYYPLYLEIRKADMLAQSPFRREEKLAQIESVARLYEEVIQKNEAVTARDLLVTGKDLIGIGFNPGPKMGRTLKILLESVIEDPALNERDTLLALAREYKEDL